MSLAFLKAHNREKCSTLYRGQSLSDPALTPVSSGFSLKGLPLKPPLFLLLTLVVLKQDRTLKVCTKKVRVGLLRGSYSLQGVVGYLEAGEYLLTLHLLQLLRYHYLV